MPNDRQSSDRTASLASSMMRMGNPLDDEKLMDQIVANVLDADRNYTAGEKTKKLREAVSEPLQQYFNTAKSLAGSVVSQADGPEDQACDA